MDPHIPTGSRQPFASRQPSARFDDLLGGTQLQFSDVEREIVAHRPVEVLPALAEVRRAVDAGWWAYGMVTYEAAAGLDPVAAVQEPLPDLPLLWFGLSRAPDEDPSFPTDLGSYRVGSWTMPWTRERHAQKVARVQEAIAEGETYQVNLTTRLDGRIEGDLLACYRDLIGAQHSAFGAHLDLGRWAVLSASPEQFLDRRGEELSSVPMKGTALRGATPAEDAQRRAALLRSEKERAENVMIVDLIRNDLARIARPGTVDVPHLLRADAYPTVWQLTSTVTADQRPGVTLEERFGAMFPCGSITGAPKLSTMALIAELETAPRGVYCGTIGWLAPSRTAADGTELPAEERFSVAIRTILVDRQDCSATYGVGGGITWASTAAGEWDELAAKTRVLDGLRGVGGVHLPPDPEDFGLLETLAVERGAPRHLEEHLDRLQASAEELAITLDRACARQTVLAQIPDLVGEDGTAILRLRLALDGTLTLTTRALDAPQPGPVRLVLDTVPIDPSSPAVRHKTTDREHLTAALARARDREGAADDVVLVGPTGLVTETSIATLMVRLDGRWCTPPLEDGCLPGIGRRLALERGEAALRSITAAELAAADEIAVVSSVRGWRPAVLSRPGAAP
ncbi:aminodeoxychorismate synthase component I [Brachybacterium alimentarium]|uniref:aminodeoxychorismate synthase component I n=1 Tax=Brachybacterium alimentarium TaxID=47845 RepID=UPI003FD002D2